ncbi:hypothetical protein NDU88_007123 [Pleurodeles waltl]|uniref:Uncharacterized protein n=1 Tax=Pleurodeles waltl TaxID=8319 RepID=A0AAV7WF92_PLEWA|nr:hypothetical protein NDU88_007123 [Pleurodeles waltl]
MIFGRLLCLSWTRIKDDNLNTRIVVRRFILRQPTSFPTYGTRSGVLKKFWRHLKPRRRRAHRPALNDRLIGEIYNFVEIYSRVDT